MHAAKKPTFRRLRIVRTLLAFVGTDIALIRHEMRRQASVQCAATVGTDVALIRQ